MQPSPEGVNAMTGIRRSTGWLILALCLVATACGTPETIDEVDVDVVDGSEAAPETADSDAPSDDAAGQGDESITGPIALVDEMSPDVKEACTADASPTIAEIQERGTLSWGTGISLPFTFRNADGEWAGVEVGNATELASVLDVDFEIEDFEYGVMATALTSNRADIVGAQLFITPERAEAIAFSDPYYVSGQLFYVLEDSEWQTIEDLNSPENRFVYGTGNAQKDIAEELIPDATITDAPLRGQVLLYEFLAANQADSSMTESGIMPLLLEQYNDPQLAAIGMNGRVETDEPSESDIINPFDVAFGVNPGDQGWLDCVNAYVEDATSSGRMAERINYWLSADIDA
ncbi:MAG: transporter substrate-binding domain-containing protein, partial [Chloroflexota bacterium]|nr:transporter substrate-binding domain-containing protein [Chloroflexota bacterium]